MFTVEIANRHDLPEMLHVLEHFNMHHIPSVEMDELILDQFYVARMEGKVVGLAGWKILQEKVGKTTLMAVLPEYNGHGIGKVLQHRRMEVLYNEGCETVITNADRPETIVWYMKHFQYHVVGHLKKLMSFGLETVDEWTTLECDLLTYFHEHHKKEEFRNNYIVENDCHPMSPYPPLIINVCLTGMVPTKNSTPYVPCSVDEIIQDAIDVYDAGARMVHIHARDEKGKPTPEVSYYEKIISGIRKERPGLVCCATTSGRDWSEFEKRSAVLYLDKSARPDMASLTTGSMNFVNQASMNTPTMIQRLALAMKEQGVKPELEVFDLGMINFIKYMERNGIIEGKKFINILMGNINTAQANIGELSSMINALPKDSIWAVAGIGQFQLPMNTAALVAGGHVRVGIEDSIYYDYGKTKLTTNKMLVERVVRISNELQREIATPEQTRDMLGLDV